MSGNFICTYVKCVHYLKGYQNLALSHNTDTHFYPFLGDDFEMSQDTDTHYCPHFHEGNQDLATSQNLVMPNTHNISPLLSQIWPFSAS